MQHSIYLPKKNLLPRKIQHNIKKNIEESLFIEYTISFLHIPKTKQNKNKTKPTEICQKQINNKHDLFKKHKKNKINKPH